MKRPPTHQRRTRARIGLVLTLGLVLTGCGAAEDQLAEGIAEEAFEEAAGQSGGGEVDVELDGDGGEVSISGEQGSITVGSGEVPESFPSDVPLPSGDYQVVSAMVMEGQKGHARLVLQADGSPEDLAEQFAQGLREAGYEVSGSTTPAGQTAAVNLFASDDEHELVLTLSQAATAEDAVLVNYTLVPVSAE